MRILLTILLFISFSASAKERVKNNNPFESGKYVFSSWYVATTGNDATGDGSIGNPYATWEKLEDVLTPGDIGYIRGGNYYPTKGMAFNRHCEWNNIIGTSQSPIRIENYPGESPVFNFTDSVTTHTDPWCVYMENCDYVIVKGLRVTGFDQVVSGAGVSGGWAITDGCESVVLQNIEVDNIGGYGFVLGGDSHNTTYIDCDAHHLQDPNSPGAEYGGSNGFGRTVVNSSNTTYIRCRAWWCSDDGWDFFNSNGTAKLIDCWSFWNGYVPGTFTTTAPFGNGEGFKLGPTTTTIVDITFSLYRCMAIQNRTIGFSSNTTQSRYYIEGSIAYDNKTEGFNFSDYPAGAHEFFNNVAFSNDVNDLDEGSNNVAGSNNSWDGGVTANSSDYVSTDTSTLDDARNADGSLPGSNFLRLVSTSDLINSGIKKTLPYCGSAPDMGPYEFNTCPVNLVRRKTVIH